MGHSRSNIAAGMQIYIYIYILSVACLLLLPIWVRARCRAECSDSTFSFSGSLLPMSRSGPSRSTSLAFHGNSIHSICVYIYAHLCLHCCLRWAIAQMDRVGSCAQDAKRHFRPYLMCLHIIIINATAAGKQYSRPYEWCRS